MLGSLSVQLSSSLNAMNTLAVVLSPKKKYEVKQGTRRHRRKNIKPRRIFPLRIMSNFEIKGERAVEGYEICESQIADFGCWLGPTVQPD